MTDSSHRLHANNSNSSSIPIPGSHIRRTISEIQLEHEQNLYALREGAMYFRLITGMIQRSKETSYHLKIDSSIKNLVQTQVSPTTPTPSDRVGGFIPGSPGSNDEEWLFYESRDESNCGSKYPLAMNSPQEYQKTCALESSCNRAIMCSKVEQDGSNDDGLIFELDL